MEDVAEVSSVVAATGPEVVNGSRSNSFVSVEVARTDACTGTTVNGLGHEGDVVGNTVGIGVGHAGHRSIGVL